MKRKCRTEHIQVRLTIFTAGLAVILGLTAPSIAADQDTSTLSPYERAQQQADLLFDEGDYEQALSLYMRLAKQGDYFAQYQLAFMHQNGLGTAVDLIEAYAWASLAAESANPALRSYRSDLSKALDQEQGKAAHERASDYRKEYGVLAVAQKYMKIQRQKLRSCTGSRVGNSCQALHVVGRPLDNTKDPGCRGDDCLLSLHPEPPEPDAFDAGVRGALFYRHVYQSIRSISGYMEDYIARRGTVTLRDLEVADYDEEAVEDGLDSGLEQDHP